MKRNIKQLSDTEFDVCVIGGGIYGACAAWDAVLRGLSVALVEKSDFCNATSFNSQNTIHGGFRYIQNMDISRVRSAVRERRTWMAIAPHLVHPLPFLVPIYRNLSKPKALFYLAFRIYDLLSLDRNQLPDPQKYRPPGRIVSPQRCLELFSEMDGQGLTGGALFYDALIHNPGRLGFSFLKSAAGAGAVIANYAEATELLRRKNNIIGVKVRDLFSKNDFLLRAKTIVNMSGPWINRVLAELRGYHAKQVELIKVMYLTVKRPVPSSAIGLLGEHGKYFFMLPWHGHSLVGMAELHHEDSDLDKMVIYEKDVEKFISDINRARPSIGLRREDVIAIRRGLLPASEMQNPKNEQHLATKARIIDHAEDGLNGLISVVGIKFTMARSIAQQIIDMVFSKLDHKPPQCQTHLTRIYGGNIERFDDFMTKALDLHRDDLSDESVNLLVRNYGSAYPEVLKNMNKESKIDESFSNGFKVIKAQVIHAIHEEMAQKLSDIVFRRTELGLLANPGDSILAACAEIAAQEMGWDQNRKESEIQQVKDEFLQSTA